MTSPLKFKQIWSFILGFVVFFSSLGAGSLAAAQGSGSGHGLWSGGGDDPQVVLVRIRALSLNQRMDSDSATHLLTLLYETLHQHPGARVILLFGSADKRHKMYRRLGLAAESLGLSPNTLLSRLEFWVLPEPEPELQSTAILRWGESHPVPLGNQAVHFSDTDIFSRLRLQRSFELGQAKMIVEVLGREDEFLTPDVSLQGARLSVLKSLETYLHAESLGLPVEIRLNVGQGLASSLFLASYLASMNSDQGLLEQLRVGVRVPYEPGAKSLPLRSLQEFAESLTPQDRAFRAQALQLFSLEELQQLEQEIKQSWQVWQRTQIEALSSADQCGKLLTFTKK